MALLRQRTTRPAPQVTRYLSASLWDDVKAFVAQLPQATETQRAWAVRSRWLMTLFYLQGLRLSEVAGGRMGDVFRRIRADGQEQWWLQTLGKGGNYANLTIMFSSTSRTPVRRAAIGYAVRSSRGFCA